MIMTKKQYIVPAIEIIDLETENIMVTTSIIKDGNYETDTEWSNKRQPSMGTWSSTNWNTEEAY